MTDSQEISIRQQARQDYREDTFIRRYPLGSIESLIYISEQQRIEFEEFFNEPN